MSFKCILIIWQPWKTWLVLLTMNGHTYIGKWGHIVWVYCGKFVENNNGRRMLWIKRKSLSNTSGSTNVMWQSPSFPQPIWDWKYPNHEIVRPHPKDWLTHASHIYIIHFDMHLRKRSHILIGPHNWRCWNGEW